MPDFKDEFKFPDEQEDKKLSIEAEGDNIDIEIEDDTPPEDRNKSPMPKEVVQKLEEDELDKYSAEAKEKLNQLKKVWHDERREKEAALREQQEALRYAQQVAEAGPLALAAHGDRDLAVGQGPRAGGRGTVLQVKGRAVEAAIRIETGPLYRLRAIDIVGDVPKESRDALMLRPGDPADAASVQEARQRLLAAISRDVADALEASGAWHGNVVKGEAVAMDVHPETSTLRVTLSRDAFAAGDFVAMRKMH